LKWKRKVRVDEREGERDGAESPRPTKKTKQINQLHPFSKNGVELILLSFLGRLYWIAQFHLIEQISFLQSTSISQSNKLTVIILFYSIQQSKLN